MAAPCVQHYACVWVRCLGYSQFWYICASRRPCLPSGSFRCRSIWTAQGHKCHRCRHLFDAVFGFCSSFEIAVDTVSRLRHLGRRARTNATQANRRREVHANEAPRARSYHAYRSSCMTFNRFGSSTATMRSFVCTLDPRARAVLISLRAVLVQQSLQQSLVASFCTFLSRIYTSLA